MTLSDMASYRQIIGCLMQRPLLLLEYLDIRPSDFDFAPAKVCLGAIKRLYEGGVETITPLEVDQEIEHFGAAALAAYKNDGGLDFLKNSYECAQLSNFKFYYTRLKKYALLRKLQKAKYDISEFYIDDKDVVDPHLESKIIDHLENSTLEQILNAVEKNYAEIRNDFLNGGHEEGDPAAGIDELIEDLQKSPKMGPSLEGKIFSSVCRGARKGCFFLKSASTSGGKSRTSVFDACHLAYPKRWSSIENSFVEELDIYNEPRKPRKVLFIVTEMDKEELQTIMLAYLSGVDEDHILRGYYDIGELTRVKYAAQIIKEYMGYFIIEEISDPNLQNVESTIRKYATVDEVEYVFFDYIHTTASMMAQFGDNLREDVVLMLIANQLKQLAKDYGLFIFSATQVNALGMGNDEELQFKDEKCIRGSKAVADKCDVGYVLTRVSSSAWNTIKAQLRNAARANPDFDMTVFDYNPTHVLDIYKMRRGRYKMIRIWTSIHLGTGERKDLFVTNVDNQPIREPLDLFTSERFRKITV